MSYKEISITKPDKLVAWSGMEIPMFGPLHIRKILGRDYLAILRAEKMGLLPRPVLYLNRRRYYTIWEIEAIRYAIELHGKPSRWNADSKHPFFTEIRNQFVNIKKSLSNGETPDIPIRLVFENRRKIAEVVRHVLASSGITDEAIATSIVKAFYNYSLSGSVSGKLTKE